MYVHLCACTHVHNIGMHVHTHASFIHPLSHSFVHSCIVLVHSPKHRSDAICHVRFETTSETHQRYTWLDGYCCARESPKSNGWVDNFVGTQTRQLKIWCMSWYIRELGTCIWRFWLNVCSRQQLLWVLFITFPQRPGRHYCRVSRRTLKKSISKQEHSKRAFLLRKIPLWPSAFVALIIAALEKVTWLMKYFMCIHKKPFLPRQSHHVKNT